MRPILIITIGLNAVLALVLWRTPRAPADLPERSMRIADAASLTATSSATNQRVVVVAGDDGLPWNALAAGNYRECMERLRQAGCPEETIRDIIMAAVSRHYRAQLVAREEQRYRNFKWWRGIQDADADYHPSAMQEVRSRRDLELSGLFGNEWRQDMHKVLGWKVDDSYWSFMSQEKRAQVDLLNAKYSQLENDINKSMRGSFLLEEEEAQMKQLKEQKRAELAQLLTPKELEDLDMRQSPAANWVKQKLPEAASEEEFRTMVRAAIAAEKDLMIEHTLLGGESPQEAVKRREAEDKAFQAQLRMALGDARYAELFPNAPPGKVPEPTFEESAERTRKDLVKLAQKEGVSVEAANEAHTRLIAVIKELEKKFGDLDKLSGTQGEELNKMVKEQGEKIFVETMGEKGRTVFRRINHDE